ncbi:MAG: sigma-E factor regulatory protein RseB domain-containing protein [bacterium]
MIASIFKRTILFISFIIIVNVSFAFSPDQLLKQAWDKEGTISLFGRMSSQGYFGDRKVLSEVELFWLPPKKIRREFISQKELRLVLVSDETSEWRYFPKRNMIVFSPMPPESKITPERWNLIQKNYAIKYLGTQPILTRSAAVINIESKNGHNPSRKLWIDLQQPVILKSEQYNSDTQLVSSSYFTELSFKKRIDPKLFAIPTSARIVRRSETMHHRYTLEEGRKIIHFSLKTATYLPAGYIVDGCYTWQQRDQSGPASIQLRYTDGLNTISIFEHLKQDETAVENRANQRWYNRDSSQRWRSNEPNQERNRRGGRASDSRSREDASMTRPQGKMVRIDKDNIQCVIFGDLPQSELQKIAQSLH